MIYLDHAATTPMRAEAVEAMLPYLGEQFANPSGSHRFARAARQAVDEARDAVAAAIGCQPNEVVFTGSGTEADNLAITGALERRGGRAVCSASEHHAVLHVVEHHGGTVVGVDDRGRLDLDQLAATLADDEAARVTVVSAMAVNNEVGSITDLAAVADVVRRRSTATLHTDAVQAATWLDLRTLWPHVDALSLSAHKFGGPKGVGVLAVRSGVALAPLILGGGQERDQRSGTHNVAGIVALAVALGVTDAERDATVRRVTAGRDRLLDLLHAGLSGCVESVPRRDRVPGSAHVMFEGVDSESLLFVLDQAGVCASAASACASGAMEPSHVLAAMGVDRTLAAGALRLTLGPTTTEAEIDRGAAAVIEAVSTLRQRHERHQRQQTTQGSSAAVPTGSGTS